MKNNLRMIVAGGGTGGHFFPAQAIIKALKDKGVKVKYIGSYFGLESKHFSVQDHDVLLLNIKGIQRHLSIDSIYNNLLFPFRFLISYYNAWKFLSEFKPHIVVGTGGYSSGIPLLVAIHKGIKTVIQEQNSFPGITTRFLAKYTDKICIAYNDVINHLKKKIVLSQEIQYERKLML